MKNTGDKVIRFVQQTDWKAVGADLRALAASLGVVAGGIKLLAGLGGGGLSGLFNVWIVSKIIGVTSALVGLAPAIGAVATMIATLEIAAAPIEAIIIAIGAIATAGWLLYANWDKIRARWKTLWDDMKGIVDAALGPITDAHILVEKGWSGLPDFFTSIWNRIKAGVPKLADLLPGPFGEMAALLSLAVGPPKSAAALPAPRLGPPRRPAQGWRAPYAPGQAPSPAAQAWAGKVQLHVTTDPGVRVQTRGVTTSGPRIEVQRGRAMAGAG